MMEINFNIETAHQAKDRLAKGYRGRRNFLIVELLTMIVLGTPVDRGEARGGWRVSVGAPVERGDGRLDGDGLRTIYEGLAALRGAGAFATIFISNPVPHIVYLENGWSGQAPNGMVKVSLAAFKHMYGDVI